jgi:hypothetical protein
MALRWTAWGIGSLVGFGVAIYAIFWMPYRNPQERSPQIMSVIPPDGPHERVDDRLNEFAWADRANGIVRIPIGLAMQLARERLPVRDKAQSALQAIERDAIPTGAGSGRAVDRNVKTSYQSAGGFDG